MSSNPQQQQKQNASSSSSSSSQQLTLDDISKHFSVPLSDAAAHLGVCVSVLKRICRENGLDRWPYRKILAGKSVEDVKKQAARERSKLLAEKGKPPPAAAAAAAAGGGGMQSASHHKADENSKLQGTTSSPHKLQQQGSRDSQGRLHTMQTPGLTKAMSALDEFKYGFPSEGLLTTSNKWWANSTPHGSEGIDGDGTETADDDRLQSGNKEAEKSDDVSSLVMVDNQKPENGIRVEGIGLLASVRKNAVEEGRRALKLGVHRSYGISKLHKKERVLLCQIFGSSLPKEWMHDSFVE